MLGPHRGRRFLKYLRYAGPLEADDEMSHSFAPFFFNSANGHVQAVWVIRGNSIFGAPRSDRLASLYWCDGGSWG
jgi:hypothetical protein